MDYIDKKIVLRLKENGRETYVDLARELGISERTVRNRLNTLFKKNILKVSALPRLQSLGLRFVGIVAMQVQLGVLQETAQKIAENKNVCMVVRVTGRFDMIATIVAKTEEEFGEIMDGLFAVCPGISRTETFSKIAFYKGDSFELDPELIKSIA
jgi:Lrp/AsnC family transcriptional regulator for asnA, asnC and gidA